MAGTQALRFSARVLIHHFKASQYMEMPPSQQLINNVSTLKQEGFPPKQWRDRGVHHPLYSSSELMGMKIMKLDTLKSVYWIVTFWVVRLFRGCVSHTAEEAGNLGSTHLPASCTYIAIICFCHTAHFITLVRVMFYCWRQMWQNYFPPQHP